MKKLFFGLAVLGIALSASAFTNAKSQLGRFATVYITGHSSGFYNYSTTDPEVCENEKELPCEVLSGDYPITTPTGTISDADFATYFSTVTTRESY